MNKVVYFYQDNLVVKQLNPDTIFVFGSNYRGVHGAGAALYAKCYFGAILGQGEGLQGQCYAVPTKDQDIATLTLDDIYSGVLRFLDAARKTPYMKYFITPLGTNLAGYNHSDIAPMFEHIPNNCAVTKSWLDFIPHHTAVDITDMV